MTSVSEHYEKLLAPIYLWMAGGIDAALAQGAIDVAAFVPPPSASAVAIDLGAGFGMHAIPLARAGYAVTAIDSSALLLAELQRQGRGLDIRTTAADLLDFPQHSASKADLILCMGDTLTHLESPADVERLFEQVSAALSPAGRAVFTFRDYSTPLQGDARFIPVRSDADRIHTCFLEEAPEHMVVHDLVHQREGTTWTLRVSSYRKLRLPAQWVQDALRRAGLQATIEVAARGMSRVLASRA